jgi:hypothetical protein
VIVDTVKNPPAESKLTNDRIWMITCTTYYHNDKSNSIKNILSYYTSEEKAQTALEEHYYRFSKTNRIDWIDDNQIEVHLHASDGIVVYKIDYERVL